MDTQTKQSQSERFEAAFNRIHKALMQTVKNAKTDKFSDLVYKGKNHAFIRYYEHDLSQFAKLRNAIVHEKIEEGFYIAEPHLEIINKIESIADEFEKPASALSIATKPVTYFQETDMLSEVLAAIKKESLSQFPVYKSNGEYAWLLTSAEIVKYLAEHFSNENMNLKQVKVGELYNGRIKHHVVFVSQDSSLFEIEDIFEEYHAKNQKIEAILITKTGSDKEKPNGIITSWDLLEAEISD
ncbi:CBS domain-containing protein [Peribacillus glennii]|uniref:CBS domain-containing protein n=1 Tax=Peribacillus glennii TaxID=2303991 RepID=A0A372LFS7_9BACI|nr:CBS domain-containing protein [Peribacillus glennii]RFU64864.1 CBS domain-containing protein [Peribacillus glennii]